MGFFQLIGAAMPWRVIGLGAGALAICGAILLYFAQAKRIEHLNEERAAAVASARPGPNATQRDAALAVADLTDALKTCNADKAALAAILVQN